MSEIRDIVERLGDAVRAEYAHLQPHEIVFLRYAIVQSQLGKLASYITHDKNVRPPGAPIPREYGVPADEIEEWGHGINQLVLYGLLRGWTKEQMLAGREAATKALEDAVWKKRDGSKPLVANPGHVMGVFRPITRAAFRLRGRRYINQDEVVVLDSALPDDIDIFRIAAVCGASILCANGGMTSHAATLAREVGVSCFVSCGQRILVATKIGIESQGTDVVKIEVIE